MKLKEIQALERLKGTLLAEGYWQDVLEDFAIIENALNKYYRLLKEDNETTKKLKALEIIRNIGILRPYETSGGQCWLEAMCDATKITKDNYDLLKEVLL